MRRKVAKSAERREITENMLKCLILENIGNMRKSHEICKMCGITLKSGNLENVWNFINISCGL